MFIRLQKYLADCGLASRRSCEKLILENQIFVNDEVASIGSKINPNIDKVYYKDFLIINNQKKVYIMLNKPTKYVTTSKDQFSRPTVLDLIDTNYRIFSIGRLDYDTSGLLLLTNDGNLAYKIMHPKHNIYKNYLAEVVGIPSLASIKKFEAGLKIENYITSKSKIKIISSNPKSSILHISIYEGKNRQIRKMLDFIGHKVISLKRISIGELGLDDLDEGKFRYLSDFEINYLKSL